MVDECAQPESGPCVVGPMAKIAFLFVASALFAAGAVAAGVPATIAQMRWQRRVLLVTAPNGTDPQLLLQRRVLREWPGRDDRDLTLVQVIGGAVEGSADTAAALHRRFALPSNRFAVLLIGKDGGVKLRSAQALSPDTLQGVIDAMPMRRAGQR